MRKYLDILPFLIFAFVGTIFFIIGIFVCLSVDFTFIIFCVLGFIFMLIGYIPIIFKIKRNNKIKVLKETGKVIYAKYENTEVNGTIRINGNCPYNIICSYDGFGDNNIYIFKSDNIWIYPHDFIVARNIVEFPVYVDMNDYSNYYVDVDYLLKNVVDYR